MTTVPAQYQGYVRDAASALGIPEQVVAAQIDLESSFNPQAKSPAGAEGIAQFEPGTFAQYGPKGGSPYNVGDAFTAYVAYMRELLHQEGGDLRKALEAYNAGPGNLPAGAGYASQILSAAGTGDVTSTGGSGVPSWATSAVSSIGGALAGTASGDNTGLFSIPIDIITAFSKATDDLTALGKWFGAFTRPATWVRVGAGILGTLLLILGIVCLGREAGRTAP